MDSIDIFDTALFRDVYEPKDIFKLMESKYPGFYQRRINAENVAINKISFYNIKDIYTILKMDPADEINMEFEHTYANPEILSMYNANPENYVFISDMYLPSQTLARMLSKAGYKNPKVFVSCEEKCNKGSGLLFKKVERRIGKINKHYGDNYGSDILGARKADIEPVFKPALHNLNLHLPVVKNPMLKKYAAELATSDEETIYKMAKYYAPLIYGFTEWVLSQRKNEAIYFMSRDMFLPYIIAKEIFKADKVYYLHASRRSLAPLYIKSGDKALIDKMHTILTEEEYNIKNKSINDGIDYLIKSGINNGDFLVDIGYSGSTQRIIEKFLNIKLQGKYMQLDKALPFNMDMKQYLSRPALQYRFLCEFMLTSPEDCIEDYKNGNPVFVKDNELRKEYAKKIVNTVINPKLINKIRRMNISLFDIEQLLIHIQNYPDNEMLNIFNEPILTNRERVERGIGFDRERILKGELLECYSKSYAQPLFKRMLEQDKELSSLLKFLN